MIQTVTGAIILTGTGILKLANGGGKNLIVIAGQWMLEIPQMDLSIIIHIPGAMMVSIIQRAGKMQMVISTAIHGKEVVMGHIMRTKEAQMPQAAL